MDKSKFLTKSQERSKKFLMQVVGRQDFEKDVAVYRQQKDNFYAVESNTLALITKYKLPDNTISFIYKYIETGEEDYSCIYPPAFVISNDDDSDLARGHITRGMLLHRADMKDFEKTYVRLLISPQATQPEIKEFLSLEWDKIKTEQRRITGKEQKRIKERPRSKRDDYVMGLHLEGQKPAQIAKTLNEDVNIEGQYEPKDIRLIISKINKRLNTEHSA